MGATLHNAVWFASDRGAHTNFATLAARLEPVTQEAHWNGYTILSTDFRTTLETGREPITAYEISKRAAAYSPAPVIISATAPLPCWRMGKDRVPYIGSVVMQLSAWDREGFFVRPSRAVEGDAAITLDNPWSFYLGEGTRSEEMKTMVEDNCLTLVDVVAAIVGTDRDVASVKSFFLDPFRQPLNAHLAYFDSDATILSDIAQITGLWHEGSPEYDEPPFKTDPGSTYLLTPVPPDSLNDQFVSRLERYLVNSEDLDEHKLARVDWDLVDHRQFGHGDGGHGRIVMNLPYPLNSTLRDFYVDLLDFESALYGGPGPAPRPM